MPEVIGYTFPECPRVRAFTTLRPAGQGANGAYGFNLALNVGDDPVAVGRNRARLRKMLPSEPHWLEQVHGNEVRTACGSKIQDPPPKADGLVARKRNTVCAVLTADCMPILLASKDGGIAAVHAGWRGLAGGILENALSAMESNPALVDAQIGPHIRQASYQVGDDAKEKLVTCKEDEDAFMADKEKGRHRCDLSLLAAFRLKRAGVGRVGVCELDTYAQPRLLYSARRDGIRTGRMATVIWRS